MASAAVDAVTMAFGIRNVEEPERALAEIRRVLKPGGSLEFVDIAGGGHGFLVRLLHGRPAAPPAGEDRMIVRLREAGFAEAQKIGERNTGFGPVAFYQARR
jgi:SAM-dependent methyltransferase